MTLAFFIGITNCFFIGLRNKRNAIFAKHLINNCKRRGDLAGYAT